MTFIFKKVLPTLFALGFLYLMHNPLTFGSVALPAIGKLFNPFTGFWANGEGLLGQMETKLDFPEIGTNTEMYLDERMVPHIFAQSASDAYFVQGYIHAKMRLWQMDISTRAASGRLSEVLGAKTLEIDKFNRRNGLTFAAENAINSWKKDKESFQYLESYTAGVNAYIATLTPKDIPLEFKLLGYEPELWTPLKSALMAKSMCNTLCREEHDVANTNLLNFLGKADFDLLYPEKNPKQSPVIPAGSQIISNPVPIKSIDTKPSVENLLSYKNPFKPDPFAGSNNWAVGPMKTHNKKAILCNDPHLNLTLPSIWFENQISVPKEGINVYGISLPGVPAVIIGFNENIAWGITNGEQDFVDLYRMKWVDDKKVAYMLDGTIQPVKWRIEQIKVKGQDNVIDSVKYTHWGPIVFEDKNHPAQDLAMRWIAHDGIDNTSELKAFSLLNRAKNYADYASALQFYTVPMQNFVFAAKNGDIALQTQGLLPLKQDQQGRFVQDGSLSANGWQGFIPTSQNPQVYNPSRGFVASANQNSTDEKYPYYYNGYFDDYRGRYLVRSLTRLQDVTVDSMKKLQNDTHSLLAEETIDIFQKTLSKTSLTSVQKQWLDRLSAWDKNFDAQKVEPIFCEWWYNNFYASVWDELNSLVNDYDVLLPEDWVTLALVEKDPSNKYFDIKSTPDRESAPQLIVRALDKAIFSMDSLTKLNPTIDWANFKKSNIPHLARIPAFSTNFLNNGGVAEALNSVKKANGPSWRMIVEMGDKPKGYGVYPGGQSGNPGSIHYDDMVSTWEQGKYNELFFAVNASEAKQKSSLTYIFSHK